MTYRVASAKGRIDSRDISFGELANDDKRGAAKPKPLPKPLKLTVQLERALRNICDPLLSGKPYASRDVFLHLLDSTISLQSRTFINSVPLFSVSNEASIFQTLLLQHKNLKDSLSLEAFPSFALESPTLQKQLKNKAHEYVFVAAIAYFAERLASHPCGLELQKDALKSYLAEAKAARENAEKAMRAFLENALCRGNKEKETFDRPAEEKEGPPTLWNTMTDLAHGNKHSHPEIGTVMEAKLFMDEFVRAINAKLPRPLRSIG